MVSGLMDDTPLGRVVGIRIEKDKDILKNFTPEQKQIRSEWQRFLAGKKSNDPKAQEVELTNLQSMIAGMFGGGR